jgi:hypothetical protein
MKNSANDAIALIAKGRDILEELYADRHAEEHPLHDILVDLGDVLARIENVVGL